MPWVAMHSCTWEAQPGREGCPGALALVKHGEELQGHLTAWPSWDYRAEQNLVFSALSHPANHSHFCQDPAKIQSYLGEVGGMTGRCRGTQGGDPVFCPVNDLLNNRHSMSYCCPISCCFVWGLTSLKLLLTSPLGILRDPVQSCIPQLLMDPSAYDMLTASALCLIRLLVQTYTCPLE